VIVARSKDRLEEIKDDFESEYDVSVRVLAQDLTDPSACEEIYDELNDEDIFVHSLVNNAGFANYGKFTDHHPDSEQALIDLNISALTQLTHRFAQDMIEEGRGRIMNVASTGAFFPAPYLATYDASKAYVLFFTEGIAEELAEHDIKVSCLCPGATKTDFVEAAGEDAEEAASSVPEFAWAEARDVAEYGYRALNQGKVVAVHGWLNSVWTTLVRYAPRSLVRSLVANAQQ
jgi:short-subunit dehydrogenase